MKSRTGKGICPRLLKTKKWLHCLLILFGGGRGWVDMGTQAGDRAWRENHLPMSLWWRGCKQTWSCKIDLGTSYFPRHLLETMDQIFMDFGGGKLRGGIKLLLMLGWLNSGQDASCIWFLVFFLFGFFFFCFFYFNGLSVVLKSVKAKGLCSFSALNKVLAWVATICINLS